jgi:CRISPR-associated endonuclease Cas3-HD
MREEHDIAGELACLCYDVTRPEGERWVAVHAEAVKPGDRIVVPSRRGGCDEWGWNSETRTEVADLGTEAHYLQRLKGTLRITHATLLNALAREGRGADTDGVWDDITNLLPEEGEELDGRDARALIETLLDRQVAFPRTWRALMEGRGRRKGIRDRRANLAALGDRDWSRGLLLYSEKTLDVDILDGEAGEEEPNGEAAITERYDSSRAGEEVSLVEHLLHVEKKARTYAEAGALDDRAVGLVALAARLHDLGKADRRFQADLRGRGMLISLELVDLQDDVLLAKSARGQGRRNSSRATPNNFRHEALSVALAGMHPAVARLPSDDRDLVLWLIGTHHGYGRPFFPPMIDDASEIEATVPDGIVGPELRARGDDAPIRLDQGWFERAERLVRRFGPWELARLEAILRLSDHVASAEEERGVAPSQASARLGRRDAALGDDANRSMEETPGSSGTITELSGLESDNLLAFLAMLGLLRALESVKPSWRPGVFWHGSPPVARVHLKAEVAQDEMLAATESGIIEIGQTYWFDRNDLRYQKHEFRDLAKDAEGDRERTLLLAALASDACTRDDGSVEPTPLCAMFGQGHQHFLTRLHAMAVRDHPANMLDLSRALFESWRYDDDAESFRWDPIEDRRYAHQFGDPSEPKNKIGTVVGANRLAAIGFGVLTCAPTRSGLATLGVSGGRSNREICWPIVGVPTSLAGHVDLLTHRQLCDATPLLRIYGVAAIARARRYQVGKFFNFDRAKVTFL